MNSVLPRVILGNRGDLASRWGLLYALQEINIKDVTVFAQSREDIPQLNYQYLPYGKARNLFPTRDGLQAFKQANTILWSVGLDLQDDSSLMKLVYLNIAFWMYRLMGLRVLVLFQGAGPLETGLGRFLANQVLHAVDLFVARDPGTYKLVKSLHPGLDCILGHDAIFMPKLESLLIPEGKESGFLKAVLPNDGRPQIGFNLRQWFHFASSILPYQFSQKKYLERSKDLMTHLLRSAVYVIQELRKHASILLISAYQPGSVPWEDDLFWLAQIKAHFQENPDVILVDQPISIPTYFDLMSRLDLVIGMRLHSTLIALRFGVPAINISYTLKGRDIMEHMGLSNNVVKLDEFITNPEIVIQRAKFILSQHKTEVIRTEKTVAGLIDHNVHILHQIFGI
jgi:polysaccharide pyruvyl transferase WcaK-like protein